MENLSCIGTEKPLACDRDVILQAVHDIRSPLTVLKVLLARLEHSQEPFQRELIEAVFNRIEAISEDMLNHSKGPCEIKSLPQAVHAVIKEKMIEYGSAVKFVSVIQPEAIEAQIDARETMRMLSNLINNAIQAGAKCVTIEVSRYMDSIHLSISDDGKGFSEQALADLNSGIAHLLAKPGHGYGLRHARNLAASLNGKFWLRSTPQAGSCVTLALPAIDSQVIEV